MKKVKQASLTDLNFDSIVNSDQSQNNKVVPEKRFSNVIKSILLTIVGIGLGSGLFCLFYYLCK